MKIKSSINQSLSYVYKGLTHSVRGRIGRIFDEAFYKIQAGEVRNPLAHYQTIGWKKGYNPHPLFDTNYYIENLNRNLKKDPLHDFLIFGCLENAKVHPLIDNKYYFYNRPDVLSSKLHPFIHYIFHGWSENCNTHPLFDINYYSEQCPGLISHGFGAVMHYAAFGTNEGKHPAKNFDPRLFRKLAGLPLQKEPFSELIKYSESYYRKNIVKSKVRTSIIILNLNNSLITIQCMFFLRQNTSLEDIEIILVDNGSSYQDLANLVKFAKPDDLIRLNTNKGFGEANNIAFERSSGENIVLLNNDAFVTDGWLPPLISEIESADVGAAGPMFLYPDGRLQEAGATVNTDGSVIQIGKFKSASDKKYNLRRSVDYISAATLALKSDTFQEILGFDLCWDPAYYEDVDLCLKILERNMKVVYNPASKVIHLEGSTSKDSSLGLHNIVENNKYKLVQRWGKFLENRELDNSSNTKDIFHDPIKARNVSKKAAIFSPFPVTPGGGERFIFSIANILRENFEVHILTIEPTSHIRILTVGRELQIDLHDIKISELDKSAANGQFDLFISIGNEAIPYAYPQGKKNIFICQFPFPIPLTNYARDWGKIDGYDGIIVYSNYSKKHLQLYAAESGVLLPKIHILNPAVPQHGNSNIRSHDTIKILHVGRFTPFGHSKKQDIMLKIFSKICQSNPSLDLELILCGSLGSNSIDRNYVNALRTQAENLNVSFYINASSQDIYRLYQECNFYWHATGIGLDVAAVPEKFEHFGITIVEAMSAGLIPVVIRQGGPEEIVQENVSGYLAVDEESFYVKSLKAINLSKENKAILSKNAIDRAKLFDENSFRKKLSEIIYSDAFEAYTGLTPTENSDDGAIVDT